MHRLFIELSRETVRKRARRLLKRPHEGLPRVKYGFFSLFSGVHRVHIDSKEIFRTVSYFRFSETQRLLKPGGKNPRLSLVAPCCIRFSGRLAKETSFPHSHSKGVLVESHASSGPPRTSVSPHSSHMSSTRLEVRLIPIHSSHPPQC